MKILISSNSPWGATGYSSQAKIILDLCREFGHEVAVYAWYGFEGAVLNIDGVPVYPMLDHPYGGDAAAILRQWPADLLITIQDIWPLPDDFGSAVRMAGAKWAAYFPIDGEPLAPMVDQMARTTDFNLIYSVYGAGVMEEAGIEYRYIPQLIDTEVYKPGDRAAARASFGIPASTYLVLMVGANAGHPGRKSFPEVMAAFSWFARKHKEAVLFLHTKKNVPVGQGYQLGTLANHLGLDGQVKFINQDVYRIGTMEPADMARLYQAADILISPSRGEGFGLPIAEAQACGTPVITQDCTAMGEITINGIAVEPLQRYYTRQNHFQFIASEERIYEALEEIYKRAPNTRNYYSQKGIDYFNTQHGINEENKKRWRDLLRSIETNILSSFNQLQSVAEKTTA